VSFVTPLFLWYFLPLFLAAILAFPARWRNGVIAVGSLLFYTVGAGGTVVLLLSCIAVNFLAGLQLAPNPWATSKQLTGRRTLVATIIAVDLAILAIWKYAGFATQQIANVSGWFGLRFPVAELALPIGISFFIFHNISYIVDIYRGERPPLRNPVSFISYIAMFPQLIAGPIVRYHEIADQLPQVRTHRLDDIAAGFPRFALGLAKKVVIADSLAPIVTACFATPNAQQTFATAWLGAVTYTLQLFFDFSGYSDMAIGLGRMLGFRLPENFNRPYSAVTITDFWRRWHMSLSRWFRDYVYIPLGGNRNGPSATYRNLSIVFLLTGLWHGANWTFVIWGAYHGALLIIERGFNARSMPTAFPAKLARRALTLLLVILGWVLFRAANLEQALVMLGHMLVPDAGGLTDLITVSVTSQRLVIWCCALMVFLLPAQQTTGRFIEANRGVPAVLLRYALLSVGLLYSAILIMSGTFSPFLYYQF
jgi:alginate O-acetyltransferase complex protein AlgI